MLSAVVAVLCQASKLIILSDIEGLYDKAKLQAASLAVNQGIGTIITNGRHPERIYEDKT